MSYFYASILNDSYNVSRIDCYTCLIVCLSICLSYVIVLGLMGGGYVIKIGTVALIILTHFYVK